MFVPPEGLALHLILSIWAAVAALRSLIDFFFFFLAVIDWLVDLLWCLGKCYEKRLCIASKHVIRTAFCLQCLTIWRGLYSSMRPKSYPSHWHLSLSVIVSYIDVVLVPFPEFAWHGTQFLKATGAACVRQPSPQAKQPTTASEAPRHVKKNLLYPQKTSSSASLLQANSSYYHAFFSWWCKVWEWSAEGRERGV